MTEDEIPNDAPLLKCWIKKSISTSKKAMNFFCKLLLILVIGVMIICTVGIVIMFGTFPALAILSGLEAILAFVASGIGYCIGIVIAGIRTIPIYIALPVTIILVIVWCILAYSLHWCIFRNFTEEDWEHLKQHDGEVVMAGFGFLFGTAFGICLWIWEMLRPDVAIAAIQAVVIVIGCMMSFSWTVGHSIDAIIYHNKRIAAGDTHNPPHKPGNASPYNVWDAAALGIVEDKDDE
jgi:hypothetical protein